MSGTKSLYLNDSGQNVVRKNDINHKFLRPRNVSSDTGCVFREHSRVFTFLSKMQLISKKKYSIKINKKFP